jgi:hypothetical protein
MAKREMSGWGAAQGQIQQAVEFLCRDKVGGERAEVIDEVVALVRSIGRGQAPEPQSDQLLERDQYERESWARRTARSIIDGALLASERLPRIEQVTLLRELAKRSLWHMPNSHDEARAITKWLDLENLKQPHPYDVPPKRD